MDKTKEQLILMKIIKNANLITMSEKKYGNIENGYVKIQDHKIIEVGKMSDFFR